MEQGRASASRQHAYGSPGPASFSFSTASATIVPMTFPYWSRRDGAELKPAIEPLMINSQILLCPQKKIKEQSSSRRNK